MSQKPISEQSKSAASRLLKAALTCTAFSAALSAALLALAALVISNIDVSSELYGLITTIMISAAALLSAYLSGKREKENGLAIGALAGAFIFAVLALLATFLTERGVTNESLIKLLALVSAGGAGGLMGVSAKPKRRRLAKS